MSTESLFIARRFNGPPESGNGGYVAGLLGSLIEGPAEVTLRAPIPLERDLPLARRAGRIELHDAGAVVAEAVPKPLDLAVPAPPDQATARRLAGLGGAPAGTDYHRCFACGRGRAPGDGLRAFCAPVGAGPIQGLCAGAWVPDASLAGPDGMVRPEFLWGALDCPGGTAIDAGEALTGRMHGIACRDLPAGESCILLAWPLGGEGRKRYAGTAVVDAAGRVRAKAFSTWIVLR